MPAQCIKQIEEEKGDPGGYADKDKEDKRRVQAKTDAGGGPHRILSPACPR